MPLKTVNPTQTKAWQKLTSHFNDIKDISIQSLYVKNEKREEQFSVNFNNILLDFSKNRITKETIDYLVELANEVDLKDGISKLFSGDKINATENRAVLHTALRDTSNKGIFVDDNDVKQSINASLQKIEIFSDKIISGTFKGYTGKSITDVVNIGIGGSYLGPKMAVEALAHYKNHLNTHFISNIDGDHIVEVLKKLNPETTLFVIVSKSFTTKETITNATTIKEWFLQNATENDVKHNFVAVSSNIPEVKKFGISEDNIFSMWNWVGGRFSMWSSVGLTISLSVGFHNFKELLDGGQEIDEHFVNTDFDKNIPVLLALISIWYSNFYKADTNLILSYTEYLSHLVPYLQQLSMESNGKSYDRNGNEINYQTGSIIWGSTGTSGQHSFMQLVHQGTKLIPIDFIGFKESLNSKKEHHSQLMANFYAQSEALAFGKTQQQVHLELKYSNKLDKIEKLLPFKVFKGNKPSNTLLFDKLTPKSLGKLVAIYEHKTFTEGYILNIFSFDQFGVELGKQLAAQKLTLN